MSTPVVAPLEVQSSPIAEAAREGLSQYPKTLPAWLFYDAQGSELFEQITALPEYYLTRTERAILVAHAPALPAYLGPDVTIAELGAGTAAKTGVLLREFVAATGSVLYQPLDISPSALEEAAASLAHTVPGVRVLPQVANYITDTYTIYRPDQHRILALYIGSSIGNFSPTQAAEILQSLRSRLESGDFLLLGVDLAPAARKSVAMLLAAYDDAAGVTAAFNKNVLVRLNRDLDANFRVESFAHRARWNAAASRIEMHLESLEDQTVRIGSEVYRFARGETIHTENSYKFTREGLLSLLQASGFAIDRLLQDDDERFAVVLAKAV